MGGLPNTTVIGMTIGVTTVNTTNYPAAVGWYSAASYVPGMKSPGIDKMEADWAKVNGTAPKFAASAIDYTDLWTAIDAIVLAGSTDREAINNAAHSGKLVVPEAPLGSPLTFKADGTCDQVPSIVKFLAGGQFTIVQNPKY